MGRNSDAEGAISPGQQVSPFCMTDQRNDRHTFRRRRRPDHYIRAILEFQNTIKLSSSG